MDAYVVTVWRRDGAFHRFVRVAPFAAAAARKALNELYAAGVVQPADVDGVSCHQVEHFDAQRAIDEWIEAKHTDVPAARAARTTELVPARVLH